MPLARRVLSALAASSAVLAGLSPQPSPAADGPAKVYELRTYVTHEGKLDALNARFRDHTCGLFRKHGMELVGFWTPLDEKDGKGHTLIYVLAFPSREAAKTSWDAFRADPDWQAARAASEKDGPIVKEVKSVFLDPTDYSPAVPAGPARPDAPGGSRVFELRTYVASPNKLSDLNKRFREHTMALFRKHGMTNVGYWTPRDEAQGKADTLVYLLAFPNREAARSSWKAFGDDPAWQKVYKESQPDDVKLAAKVTSVFLTPTDYSPMK